MKQFPIVKASGTNYEVGRAVGQPTPESYITHPIDHVLAVV